MKKVIFIIITIIIVIAGYVLIKNNMTKKYDYEISKITEYNYFIYKENEHFGVIDKNGNKIIDAQYETIIIPNPEKDIFICYKNENNEILNSNNEKLFTNYEKIEPIKLKNVTTSLAYEKSVLSYKKNGMYGLIDFQGKEITKNLFDSIENLQPTEGKFLVSKNGKYGVIDLNGNNIVDMKYDNVFSDEYYTQKEQYKKSGFIVLNKVDNVFKFGYVSYTGKMILDLKYNEIERIQKDDKDSSIYLIVSDNGKYGLYKKSKKIIGNEYQDITYDENLDLVLLQKEKKYGAASLEGKIVVKVENDEINSKGIYLYTKLSNTNKVYDSEGNVVDINYNRSIYKTEHENYMISTMLNNNITYYGIIDKNFNKLVDEKYRYIEYLYKNYFIATDDSGKLGVINSNGKVIVDMKYSTLQKIKGKNIIQAVEENSDETEFYSQEIKKVAKVKRPNIQIQDDYILISNDEEQVYLDNFGNHIQNTKKLKNAAFPENIAEYRKEQVTLENVYYVKK